MSEKLKKITIGKSDSSGKPLKPATEYCITFLMENVHKNRTSIEVYYTKLTTPIHEDVSPHQTSFSYIYAILFLIVVIIVVGVFIFW